MMVLAFGGLLLACIFSGVETSLILADRPRLKRLAGAGDARALSLFALLKDREKAQLALSVGFHGGLALGAVAFTGWALHLGWLFPSVLLGLGLYGMSVFVLQLTFRSAFRENGEALLLSLTPWLRIWMRLAGPFVALVGLLAKGLDVTMGSPGKRAESMVSREAVHRMIEDGLMDRGEKNILRRAARLREKMVKEVMVPRTDMVSCEIGISVESLRDVFIETGHSRLPIYEGTVDEIEGVVVATDLLRDPSGVEEVLRPAYFVPETKRVDRLLRECQEQGIQMAVVVDEYGGTAGLVTVEDLVEEIVGEIADEFDPDIKEYWMDRKGVLHVSAKMSRERANETLGLDLPDDEDVETLGGFVLKTLDRVPGPGEQLTFGSFSFTVVEADEQGIGSLRIETVAGEGIERRNDT